ncbi:Homologous-pairing protein 2-like [Porphyridium purpureum]|uniref:Homologous-pairing protein 2-like n=1 Tax=Porphyridium purpureum TaxID=35688 RepID=A0A5J4Z299_PORPP|nr:Homologous-pairing protein 2-like [Porphyridium purpureum]|eukprot:POR8658..scf208_2
MWSRIWRKTQHLQISKIKAAYLAPRSCERTLLYFHLALSAHRSNEHVCPVYPINGGVRRGHTNPRSAHAARASALSAPLGMAARLSDPPTPNDGAKHLQTKQPERSPLATREVAPQTFRNSACLRHVRWTRYARSVWSGREGTKSWGGEEVGEEAGEGKEEARRTGREVCVCGMAPKKAAAAAGKKADDATTVVAKYMEAQNRPFSVQNVVDALQKDGVKKKGVETALAALVEDGAVMVKEYGKAKIYLAAQQAIELPSPEEMHAIDEQIKAKDAELKALVKSSEEQHRVNAALKSQMTEQEARQELLKLEADAHDMHAKLDKLGDPANLISAEQMQAVGVKLFKAKALWKKRRRQATDIVETFCESMNKKPSVLCEELCVERDEDVGVALQNVPNGEDPTKLKRKRVSETAESHHTFKKVCAA